jgi:ABC-type bacteriocin/lantibiotic exporter with double-glycine peptidase domain
MLIKSLIYRKLPWVRVVEARDCGAAVFASIARSFRHHLTLEQARNLVGTDRNGTTLAGLRDGGRAIGLDARPAHATYAALGQLPLPAIAHLNGREGHYVVVYKWTPEHVIALDPNRGLERLTRQQFEERWSGYLVEFRRTPSLQRREPDFRPVRLFARFAQQHAGLLTMALLFAVVATSLGWTVSFFLGTLLDRILPDNDANLLVALGLGLVLVSGMQAILQFGRLWLAAAVGRRIHVDYGLAFVSHLMHLPLKVFDARCVPGLVMRITQADLIQQAITEGSVLLLSDGIMFLIALAVILHFDTMAALIALGAVPLVLLVTFLLDDRVYNSQLTWMVRMEEFGAQMVDTFDSLRTIKTFSAEQRYQEQIMERMARLTAARFENRVALALPTAWSLLAASLITAGMLWYGSSRVLDGGITAGALLVLFGMVTFYLTPVQRFPTTLLSIRGALIGIERLEEIRHLEPEVLRTQQPRPLRTVRGEIRFENVSFAYNRHHPVLKDISLSIRPGETVAIVGETGSGKTSLANLIAGFYLPDDGDVLIDGISTRRLVPEQLRSFVSAVFQDSKLLQQSVRDNITLLADASLDEVREAARLANADTFIGSLLNGYDSQVARGGDNFSSGQAQRIAIARALLKEAPILLLDEATSNLDGATERGVLQALSANRQGRTTVVIAHRLSTVLSADRVYVLDDGEIVEAGTHEELMRLRGRYYDLFHWQTRDSLVLP